MAMVPLVYLLASIAVLQRDQLAVTQAAREAGRAFATSESAGAASERVAVAVRLALAAHGLPDDVRVAFVAADTSCDAAEVVPQLRAGASFTVCVLRRTVLPAIPRIVAGKGIESVGRYTVHVDDFRAVAP